MPDPTQIITLTELKAYLQVTTAQFDGILTSIKNAMEEFVKSYCHDPFLHQTFTEYHDGNGTQSLLVDNYPITAIDEINIDTDRAFAESTEVDASEIITSGSNDKRGLIQLAETAFDTGVKNVKVVYSAGYATLPEDLKHAVKALCAREFLLQDKKMVGITSQNVSDKTVTLDLESMPRNVFNILQAYRRPLTA